MRGWFGRILSRRRLTMLQLASTCEAMGIPKDTVKTLRRWDRVHMIKELAGVAVSVSATVPHSEPQATFLFFFMRLSCTLEAQSDLFRSKLTAFKSFVDTLSCPGYISPASLSSKVFLRSEQGGDVIRK